MNYNELGYNGLKEFSGYVEEAYSTQLFWPAVQPLYSRMRRSDPEVSVVRVAFTSLARSVSLRWELPDNPTDGDKQAAEFADSVLQDIEGGVSAFLESLVGNVPFFGWGWWEVLPGFRNPAWRPPGGDPWRSQYDDNRIGVRRLAWRDSSSFYKWQMADNGTLQGMWQWSSPDPQVLLPLENSLHITLGDAHNPEGLTPLEAVWRLERIKYGLEIVQGIGFEHAAGYLDVVAENTLTPADKAEIKRAARAIMSAQEGNYAAWPKGVTGELKDVPFQAAPAILEAIRYFGLLKLMVYNMQWVAIAGVGGVGGYSAMQDSSGMFIGTYNAMIEGFVDQIDSQVGRRLFIWNQFPGMTKRPRLKADPINKVELGKLGALLVPLSQVLDMGDEDQVAIRKQTGFLPESLPAGERRERNEPDTNEAPEEQPESAGVQDDAESTAETVQQALIRYREWARLHSRAEFARLGRKA